MLNMSDINDIRDLARRGYRISEIAEKTGRDPKTINKYLAIEDFSEAPPAAKTRPSILDPYKDKITEWVTEDQKRWVKQRHTAQRIYKRLTEEEGYTGSYDTVQRFVKTIRITTDDKGTQELIWDPGSGQVDFGEADFQEGVEIHRRKYLVVSFPYSNDSFTQIFGGETAECVCQGLEDIFNFIGGVPPLLVFDNATGVGHRICDKVKETELFKRFRAHYGFSVRFCNPHAGYEKGNVESKVGFTRRNLFVPMRQYQDMIEFNKSLLFEHRKKAEEPHYKKLTKISELFKEDQAAFLPLPRTAMDIISYEWFKADGYGKVCIDGKHFYSTRPENHNQKVLVGKRAHYIDILNRDGSVLVRHHRDYGDDRTDESDYSTSIDVLVRNSGAWMNSGLRRDMTDPLRAYMDGLEKKARKAQLSILADLNREYGYTAAVNAMDMALRNNGEIHRSDATILAQRITGYGINTPPDSGPSLKVYDDAFLPSKEVS